MLMRKNLIVVLGMHRSGTSVLAASLAALGLWAGKEEDRLGATPENARGYWELRSVVEFNDDLLAALGSTWDALSIAPVVRLGSSRYDEFSLRAKSLLHQAFGDSSVLVLKDPRMCRLLDFWIPQFDCLGLRVRYVLALRDPLECASSIHQRDRLPVDLARWLWVDHLVSAHYQTAGRERLFVSYSALLQHPLEELLRLACFVGVDSSAVTSEVAGVVETGLRHQTQTQDEIDKAFDVDVDSDEGDVGRRLYHALMALTFPADAEQFTHAEQGVSRICNEVRQLRAGTRHVSLDLLPAGGIPSVKTAVLFHFFYIEQWPQFVSLFEKLSPDIDLFVTITGPQEVLAKKLVEAFNPKARILVTPNRGRDIGSFIQILPTLIKEGYACVCKLHTKRSDYAQIDGKGWRFDLWGGLLGQPDEVERIRADFGIDQTLGLLSLQDYWVWEQDYKEICTERVTQLAHRLFAGDGAKNWRFFAGTMFWFRPAAMRPLLELQIESHHFEPELGQREGTLAHAIERVIPLGIRASGHRVRLMVASPLRQGQVSAPAKFARSFLDQLRVELRLTAERLSAAEDALAHAQSLAFERLERLETLHVALDEAQRLALERMERVEALHAALNEAQRIALERQAYIDAFQHSFPGRLAQILRRIRL